jgi:hypothetical protein
MTNKAESVIPENEKNNFNPEFRFILNLFESGESITFESYKAKLEEFIKSRNLTRDEFFQKIEEDINNLMKYYIGEFIKLGPQMGFEWSAGVLAALFLSKWLVGLNYTIYPAKVLQEYLMKGKVEVIDKKQENLLKKVLNITKKYSPTGEAIASFVRIYRLQQLNKMNQKINEEIKS